MVMMAPEVPSERQSGSPAQTAPKMDAMGAKVRKAWQDICEDLARERRDYWLNLAYFLDEQWIWWDRHRRIVQQLPQQYSPLGPGKARITVNRMAPNIGSVVGRMLSSELAFEITPSSIADDVTEGARRGERTLHAYHRDQDWEMVRYDELLSCILGGTSAVMLEWDGRRGQPLHYDEATRQVVGTGDPVVRALNITEFGLQPKVRDYRDATYWCSGLALPPKVAQEMYRLTWTPKPDTGTNLSPLQHRLMADSGRAAGDHVVLVLSYYERPNHRTPKGMVATVINGVTVSQGAWPFPFEELNLDVFRQRKVPSQWTGSTYCNSAIPLQFAYNHASSVIAEHMKLSGNARLLVPYGAAEEEAFTDSPGSIVYYSPDLSGQRPDYLAPPPLPQWMTNEAATLRVELDDVMFVHDASRGIGFDRASGQALAVLTEKDDSPLTAMAREQRTGWGSISSKVLKLLGEKVRETRITTAPAAKGIPDVLEWNGEMLRKQYDVTVPIEAVMPRSPATQQAFAKDLWDRQIITDPRQYARMMGLPPDDFGELLDADAASAQRENLRMVAGYVELPQDFEIHATHIAEHNRFRKTDSYKYAPDEIRQIIDQHIDYHEQKQAQELGEQTKRAAMDPALAAMPQASEPIGSEVPPDAIEQQAAISRQMGASGGTANAPRPGPGGTSPGMSGLAAMLTAMPDQGGNGAAQR